MNLDSVMIHVLLLAVDIWVQQKRSAAVCSRLSDEMLKQKSNNEVRFQTDCGVVCVLCLVLNVMFSLQAVCEEMSHLAPKAGLHHDGVVFGSDDFCASIGGFYSITSMWTVLSFYFFQHLGKTFRNSNTPAVMGLLIHTHMFLPARHIFTISKVIWQ